MSDRKPKDVESPDGATAQRSPNALSKMLESRLQRRSELEAPRILRPDETGGIDGSGGKGGRTSGGVVDGSGGGGVGGRGGNRSSNPFIQVTRASTERVVPPGPSERPSPSPGHTAVTAKDPTAPAVVAADERRQAAAVRVESPAIGSARTSTTGPRNTTASLHLQTQQQTRPLFPGVVSVVIGAVLFCVGVLLAALGFMVIGLALVIFGAMLLVCGSFYLAICGVERFMTQRQRNFREMAREQGPGWLTKPTSRRMSRRGLQRTSSTEMSNSSDEKVQTIEDLNLENNEPLLTSREGNTRSVTKATVVVTTKDAKSSRS